MLKVFNKLRIFALYSVFFLFAPLGLIAQNGEVPTVTKPDTYHSKYLQIGHQFSDSFNITRIGNTYYLRDFAKTSSTTNLLNQTATIKLDLEDGPGNIEIQYVSSKTNLVTVCDGKLDFLSGYDYQINYGFKVPAISCMYLDSKGEPLDRSTAAEGFEYVRLEFKFSITKPAPSCNAEINQIKSLTASNSKLQTALTAANDKVAKTEASLKTANASLKAANSKIVALEKEIKRLRGLR